MEKYLKEEYDVFEDKRWLTDESEIEDYFHDNGYDLFDCGQGYYEDSVTFLIKIKDKFYSVTVNAEVVGHWQDRGDKLYQVERIESVVYKEIPKPLPKERTDVTYNLSLTEAQKRRLESFMSDNYIQYKWKEVHIKDIERAARKNYKNNKKKIDKFKRNLEKRGLKKGRVRSRDPRKQKILDLFKNK